MTRREVVADIGRILVLGISLVLCWYSANVGGHALNRTHLHAPKSCHGREDEIISSIAGQPTLPIPCNEPDAPADPIAWHIVVRAGGVFTVSGWFGFLAISSLRFAREERSEAFSRRSA
jgi:hypothetical protein